MCSASDSHSDVQQTDENAIRDPDGYPYKRTLFDYDPNILSYRGSSIPHGTGRPITITGIYDAELVAIYYDRVCHVHSDGSEHDTTTGDGAYECIECGATFKLQTAL